MNKPFAIAGIVAAILIVGVGMLFIYRHENTRSGMLANKARCSQDGRAWVSSHFEEIPPDTITLNQNFTYSPELETCLVDIERRTLMGPMYSIYDIYSNKQIVWYKLGNPSVGAFGAPSGSEKDYRAAQKKYFGD